jgi:hypothetical protein
MAAYIDQENIAVKMDCYLNDINKKTEEWKQRISMSARRYGVGVRLKMLLLAMHDTILYFPYGTAAGFHY